jgi:hypothetical protein
MIKTKNLLPYQVKLQSELCFGCTQLSKQKYIQRHTPITSKTDSIPTYRERERERERDLDSSL